MDAPMQGLSATTEIKAIGTVRCHIWDFLRHLPLLRQLHTISKCKQLTI